MRDVEVIVMKSQMIIFSFLSRNLNRAWQRLTHDFI